MARDRLNGSIDLEPLPMLAQCSRSPTWVTRSTANARGPGRWQSPVERRAATSRFNRLPEAALRRSAAWPRTTHPARCGL